MKVVTFSFQSGTTEDSKKIFNDDVHTNLIILSKDQFTKALAQSSNVPLQSI